MTDTLFSTRVASQQALHFSYEKAGQKLDNQRIPWNADAVVVEAIVRLPASGQTRDDFRLNLTGRESVAPDSMRREGDAGPFHIFFRLIPISAATEAELSWRNRPMGKVDLPFVSRQEFIRDLSLQLPTLSVNLGPQSVACRSFVSPQSKGLMAGCLIANATALAPLADMDLEVEFYAERSGYVQRVPVQLAGSQLQGKQALVTVCPHKCPKKTGPWDATWLLDGERLAAQRIRAVTKRHFERSLRISETRYVVQNLKGEVNLLSRPPELNQLSRLGPCFLISSQEPGMAGLCNLQTRAVIAGAIQSPLLVEQEVLITDSLTPFVPGTLDAADLEQVTGFELNMNGQCLGILPMEPSPASSFTSEGGFKPAMDYTWSSAAEDQLLERLTKLMGDNGNGRTKQ